MSKSALRGSLSGEKSLPLKRPATGGAVSYTHLLASGDGIYKLDYNKVLEYHIEKKADITVVCKDMPADVDVTRFGMVKTNADGRITEFEEKPMVNDSTTISCGIYVIRRRQLIELIERCANEDRYDFVQDILVRYKNLKRIYAYKLDTYWSNIASVEAYYQTNMDFLKPEVRSYFFKEYPDIYSKICLLYTSIRSMCRPRMEYRPESWYCYGLATKKIDDVTVVEHGGSLTGVSSNICLLYTST